MKRPTVITLEDYLKVRGFTRAKLAEDAGISEKTLDRWFSRSSRLQRTKVRKVAQALGLDEEVVRVLIANGQKARNEPTVLRELRYPIALMDRIDEQGTTDASELDVIKIKKRLTTIRFAAKRAAEQLDSTVQETFAAQSPMTLNLKKRKKRHDAA